MLQLRLPIDTSLIRLSRFRKRYQVTIGQSAHRKHQKSHPRDQWTYGAEDDRNVEINHKVGASRTNAPIVLILRLCQLPRNFRFKKSAVSPISEQIHVPPQVENLKR